jgi:hypothetical protein
MFELIIVVFIISRFSAAPSILKPFLLAYLYHTPSCSLHKMISWNWNEGGSLAFDEGSKGKHAK